MQGACREITSNAIRRRYSFLILRAKDSPKNDERSYLSHYKKDGYPTNVCGSRKEFWFTPNLQTAFPAAAILSKRSLPCWPDRHERCYRGAAMAIIRAK